MRPFFNDRKWLPYWLLAVLLVSLVLNFLTLNHGHHWGDDFSVYLAQGEAIAKGVLGRQFEVNGEILMSSKPHVYAWGFSTLLAPIYWLVGFDRVEYSSIIYYKAPVVLCLAAWGVVLFLFYRRRFGNAIAFSLALLVSSHPTLLSESNNILTDIPFSTFSWTALLLMDYLLAPFRPRSLSRGVTVSVLIGITIYIANTVRYVGVLLLAVLFVAQLLNFVTRNSRKQVSPITFGTVIVQSLPYLAFLLLHVIVGLFISYPSNQASDYQGLTISRILTNFKTYANLIAEYVAAFLPFRQGLPRIIKLAFAGLLFLTMLVGAIRGIRRDAAILVYAFITLVGLVALPYTQGLRYVFNILPCFVLLLGYGVQIVSGVRKPTSASSVNNRHGYQYLFLALILLGTLVNSLSGGLANMRSGRHRSDGAYSSGAIDMYQYIQENAESSRTMLFHKARALSFNIDAMCHFVSAESIWGASEPVYYLMGADSELVAYQGKDLSLFSSSGYEAQVVHSNESMTLFRLMPITE